MGRRPGWLCEDFYFYPLPKGQGLPGMGAQSLRPRLGAELLPSDPEPLVCSVLMVLSEENTSRSTSASFCFP